MHTRDALLPDAAQIHELISSYSTDGTLLPRSLAEICENVRDFVVLEDAGQVVGCGALHLYGPHLAEIRSITVNRNFQKRGGGELLSIPYSRRLKCPQREDLPDKITKDCCACPRYHCCDEVAMVKGELPGFAILPEPTGFLVKLQA